MAVGRVGRTIGTHDPEEAPVNLHETIVIAEQRRHDLLDDAANLRAQRRARAAGALRARVWRTRRRRPG